MESLKKLIPLSQAAKLSGYHQDYLGYLIRKGEMKGKKVGRAWFTTEEEVKNYLFKQKIRQKEYALVDFLSPRRTTRILLMALGLFIVGFSLMLYAKELVRKTPGALDVAQVLSPESEIIVEAEDE